MSRTKGVNDPNRDPTDFYATPAWCVQALLQAAPWILPAKGRYLEPCAGSGSIVAAVEQHFNGRGAGVRSWDCVELRPDKPKDLERLGEGQLCGLIRWSVDDYLTLPAPLQPYDVTVTNAPYRLAESFVKKTIEESRIAIHLLRLNFLEGQERCEPWLRTHMPDVYALAARPSFTGGGTDGTGYGWFVWRQENYERRTGSFEILPLLPFQLTALERRRESRARKFNETLRMPQESL